MSAERSEGLKACPCGNSMPEMDTTTIEPDMGVLLKRYRVLCCRPGCGMNTGWKDSPEEAQQIWNRRPEGVDPGRTDYCAICESNAKVIDAAKRVVETKKGTLARSIAIDTLRAALASPEEGE